MIPKEIIYYKNPELILSGLFNTLHSNWPVKQEDLETLSYIKQFYPTIFSQNEKRLMYLLGLFYKIDEPEDILSFSYSIFSKSILEETGQSFTPVQASIRNKILENKYFSFSAPTSAGKSFLFRELIKNQEGDIVIVVPSRALIAEYILAVKEIIWERKDILILQFVDSVNRRKTSRKIIIVTPERASDIFKSHELFNPSLFLYDEAQISEEKIRGTTFDAFVRRAERVFPNSKKVFAHPFVENPEAQFKKHNFTEDISSRAYNQNTVGKIYLWYDSERKIFECFSPFIDKAHHKKNREIFPFDIVKEKLLSDWSILIYISKESIYDKSFKDDFEEYISLCKPITEWNALKIIDEIEELIGASDKHSELIHLMRFGVVVHHGSIPLNVRFLIEKFTKEGFARICFATSTLIQGINMPFDIVWIENARFTGSNEDKTIWLKNLIGRAGRSTSIKNHFDYGFVIVKNIKSFVERFNWSSQLDEESQLNKANEDAPKDLMEFINAVKEDDFNNEYNLPNSKTNRLKSERAVNLIRVSLDFLFREWKIISGSAYREMSDTEKEILKKTLIGIYELSLGRELCIWEKTILSASITILLWQIQGKSFKELLWLRYSYLTNQKEQRRLKKLLDAGIITSEDYTRQIGNLDIEYSVIPELLPNSNLTYILPSRFGNKKVKDFNYDLMLYDTYDFLDKVISFSLSDIFISAFDQFYILTNDPRAKEMVNYLSYGTNEDMEIWLMRYWFSIEEAEKIKPFVSSIDENEIVFSPEIQIDKNKTIQELVTHYL